jgi:hypothetical protein
MKRRKKNPDRTGQVGPARPHRPNAAESRPAWPNRLSLPIPFPFSHRQLGPARQHGPHVGVVFNLVTDPDSSRNPNPTGPTLTSVPWSARPGRL